MITNSVESGQFLVGLLDVASKKITWITDTQWEATAGNFSPNNKSLSYDINADGIPTVYLYDIASRKSTRRGSDEAINAP